MSVERGTVNLLNKTSMGIVPGLGADVTLDSQGQEKQQSVKKLSP